MDRRYTDFQPQSSASSSMSPASRVVRNNDAFPPRSEAIHDQAWQYTTKFAHRHETVTSQEGLTASMSGGRTAMILDRLPSQLDGLDGRCAEDGSGGGSYGSYELTGRQADYGRDLNEFAAQTGPSQQYANTARDYYMSQTTHWPPHDGSTRRNIDPSNDLSDSLEIQSDHNMIEVQYERHDDDEDEDDEDDANDENDSRESDGPSPSTTLSDLERRYKPSQCLLPGCKGEYRFKTFHSYRSHIHNVHEKFIWCPSPDCIHPRPFANKSDVDRHYRSKHGDKSKKPFKCLKDNCTARAQAFNRKDKLREHDRKYHSECCCFFCPRTQWFETFEECVEHTNTVHHGYAASG
ncbi:hypothetical protein VTL71DRAFT_7119 [Oculimacula yallundae]|uniref:C2H2-type domain-containing protein n=1 Tax=Oculimacula yallundae TaxID=86028 RepID=A0ABR4BX99_9HELO